MWNLKEKIRNVRGLDEKKFFFTIIKNKEVQKFVIDLNRLDQLFKTGTDAEGDVIGEYSAFTELINQGKSFSFGGVTKTKKQGDPIFLFDEGDFYASWRVKVEKDGLTLIANPITEDGTDLTNRFGDAIIGINEDESKTKFSQRILGMVIEQAKNQMLK